MEHMSDKQQSVRLEWVGPLAFARRHPGPPGVDLDLGATWGPRGDQRISWRHELDSDVGRVYAYDPLGGELAVLAPRVSRNTVLQTYRRATHDLRVTTVEAFAALTQRMVHDPVRSVGVAGLEPEL